MKFNCKYILLFALFTFSNAFSVKFKVCDLSTDECLAEFDIVENAKISEILKMVNFLNKNDGEEYTKIFLSIKPFKIERHIVELRTNSNVNLVKFIKYLKNNVDSEFYENPKFYVI